jgi:N-acyl-D-amino-acid deacylase
MTDLAISPGASDDGRVNDVLIRGGTIVDGTGSPPVAGDVRVRDGRIAEIGTGLRPEGEQELDAAGAIVTPGFIDLHTHVDPQLFWDPLCDPLPQHGVTSVLFGNCSLSLAPVRAADREILGGLFCYIEDLPEQTFRASVPWTWESYADYRAVVAEQGYGVNVASLVGHNAMRIFVMGDAAWERPATDAEQQRLAEVLDGCLRAGAFGMSTSLGFDEDRNRRPVPSRVADDAEFGALFDVLSQHDGWVQFIPAATPRQMRRDIERMTELTGPRGLTSTFIGIFFDEANPSRCIEMLDWTAEIQATGVRTYPQISPRGFDIRVNWSGGMSFFALPDGWHRFVQASPDEKRHLIGDPTWRAVAREEWDRVPRGLFPHNRPERVRLVDAVGAENEVWIGRTLEELAAVHGKHVSDVLADWVLANDLAPGIVAVGVLNADEEGVAATIRHPARVVGNSDAGAHLQMFCAVGDTTLVLQRHVRDRNDLSLSQAVHELTQRPADLFGFTNRGVLRLGAAGDLVVFVLDDLSFEPEVFVSDLPGGARRLRRPPGGFRYTVVDGVVTQEAGELTGARPGVLLAGPARAG